MQAFFTQARLDALFDDHSIPCYWDGVVLRLAVTIGGKGYSFAVDEEGFVIPELCHITDDAPAHCYGATNRSVCCTQITGWRHYDLFVDVPKTVFNTNEARRRGDKLGVLFGELSAADLITPENISWFLTEVSRHPEWLDYHALAVVSINNHAV